MSTLSSTQLKKAAALQEKIEALNEQLDAILSGSAVAPRRKNGATPALAGQAEPKQRRTMSPEGRAKIAAAAKRRWRAAKAAGRTRL